MHIINIESLMSCHLLLNLLHELANMILCNMINKRWSSSVTRLMCGRFEIEPASCLGFFNNVLSNSDITVMLSASLNK